MASQCQGNLTHPLTSPRARLGRRGGEQVEHTDSAAYVAWINTQQRHLVLAASPPLELWKSDKWCIGHIVLSEICLGVEFSDA